MTTVYFDHNSTTALKPEVLQAMLPWLSQTAGNATSRHIYGRNVRDAVEAARKEIAECVGVQASQVVFTSGGTEANNFAVKGITTNLTPTQILVSAIEHPCVSRPAQSLAWHDWKVQTLEVNTQGVIDLADAEQKLNTHTGLVSAMLANNETGAIQPIAELAALTKAKGALLHTDAVQAFGKLEVDFGALGVNAMTISSHKIGGPVGVGALILDKRLDIAPLLHGGGQERGLRSGTENVAGIVGFAKACKLAVATLKMRSMAQTKCRDQLETGLQNLNAVIFGQQAERLPNTSFFAIPNIEGETLVTALDKAGYAVASGSACSSDSTEPSHVLLAMGIEPDLARSAVRVSLGESNSEAEVQGFLKALQQEVKRLKGLNAVAA
ncbi:MULTISPECIES: cysteine desulfurase family protein [unclassified Methylophilus]|uniref:cysteine desulfurase family protein n=1 Tax=unclassified Methylophilus TaxID=2630143 RepID=UPI0006F81152|nr:MULTISPECIES: cysteine desulfurase family protein [unclassified Methylophilus]KQT41545.1 cysteine desulfurase [Methylophilus sp. Leaf416]KQT55711.1 cysteine desulfurase [Methylophilus sp. Leaf459]